MTEAGPTTPRPLRADAERNRQAILCAAVRVFAEQGTAVTLEHIADVARVGVGTIYRRFSSIDELVTVVMEEKIGRYADQVEQAAARAEADPAGAFEDCVLYILEQQAADLAFSELILSPGGASALFRSEIARALDASILLVDRARAAGVIRADFDYSDLYMMLNANAGIVRGIGRTAPDSWRRFGQYMLQAFRHSGEQKLTPPPRGWARAGTSRHQASKERLR